MAATRARTPPHSGSSGPKFTLRLREVLVKSLHVTEKLLFAMVKVFLFPKVFRLLRPSSSVRLQRCGSLALVSEASTLFSALVRPSAKGVGGLLAARASMVTIPIIKPAIPNTSKPAAVAAAITGPRLRRTNFRIR